MPTHYRFLAGSPDGLIDESGIIEIKCPYRNKENDPNEVKFDFLCSDNLPKINSNYYFQIQGLLEITDRCWSDFVIFTFMGIKIVRAG